MITVSKMSETGRKILTYYSAYALLRCSEYSADSIRAENLAICVLAAASIFAENPACFELPGDLIDRLIAAITPDTEDKAQAENTLLLPDEKMRQLAEAINKLKATDRQILVLYHIEMMNAKEISQIYNKPIPRIRDAITNSEKELAGHLAELRPEGLRPAQEDICLWLDELAEALKAKNLF